MRHKKNKEIESLDAFFALGKNLKYCTIQNLDFRESKINWQAMECENTAFLGCRFATLNDEFALRRNGALIYQPQDGLPYNPFRKKLYTWQELLAGHEKGEENTFDYKVYQHFSENKYSADINETLMQRLHDHAIDDALADLLAFDDKGMSQKKCVGFMGGHSTLRTDEFFAKVAQTAQILAQKGYFVASGGGPGTMEAANLGAYLGAYNPEALSEALKILSHAPHYTDSGYLQAALKVREIFPKGIENLAVPTWFYGHEPSNLFASHIAKYFSNSLREDGLLAICLYGVIYAPGSAGTTQEIFMDATQNHYGTFGFVSPMAFLGKKRYLKDSFIFPLLQQLAWGRKYAQMLTISDSPQEIAGFIEKHPPIPA